MTDYLVNKRAQLTGEHEVHNYGCDHLPETHNREYLGDFASCVGAVREAKNRGYNADGCYWCSPGCHTR